MTIMNRLMEMAKFQPSMLRVSPDIYYQCVNIAISLNVPVPHGAFFAVKGIMMVEDLSLPPDTICFGDYVQKQFPVKAAGTI